MFHQPAIPLPEEGRPSQKRKFAEGPVVQPKTPVEPTIAPGEDHTNKGNQLLKKMGWKDGAGLGLDESGRKAPVEQLMFAERAGIGASKGKDATKYQGFEGYAQHARDSVGFPYRSQRNFCVDPYRLSFFRRTIDIIKAARYYYMTIHPIPSISPHMPQRYLVDSSSDRSPSRPVTSPTCGTFR